MLALAGISKIRRPGPTAAALGRWGNSTTVRFLGLTEIGIGGAALLFGAALPLIAAYASFTLWTWQRRSQSCGCFGSEATIETTHVAFNVLATVVAVLGLVTGVDGLPVAMAADWMEAGPLTAAIMVGSAAGVLLLNRSAITAPVGSQNFQLRAMPRSEEEGWLRRLSNTTMSFGQTAVSRRDFLGKAALAGTALAVAPRTFVLQPVTAYAAICDCQGQDCACGSLCCDGYTAFCCTIYGDNACPPGSIAAGWWKADGSGFCDSGGVPQPRYYIDCNAECSGCSCVNGFCDPSCVFCDCQCAGDSCDNRKACCTKFRYGQCNQDETCIGPIVCRVVTCVPPWVWDPSCGTTSATDNNTAFHDAACLHVGGAPDDLSRTVPGGVPLLGDWNGDGTATPGIFRDGVWYLSNHLAGGEADVVFVHGQRGDIPIVGDWDGSGRDRVGIFRAGQWRLRPENAEGSDDIVFYFGDWGDTPVPGDWSGDGVTTPGIVRHGIWYLRYSNTSGLAEHSYPFGLPTDIPIAADYNGDGYASPAVVRDGEWFIRNRNSFGPPDVRFEYGLVGDIPVVGNWTGNGRAMPAIVRGPVWHLRGSQDTGPSTRQLEYGTRWNYHGVAPR